MERERERERGRQWVCLPIDRITGGNGRSKVVNENVDSGVGRVGAPSGKWEAGVPLWPQVHCGRRKTGKLW